MARLGELGTGKYRRDWRVPLLPGTTLSVGYNWSLIRFSDVLLMFAEAESEINNGPTPAAISAYEEVRKRGYRGNTASMGVTPTNRTDFFDAVANERFLEFGHEGIRKFDLIRWNLLAVKLQEARNKIVQLRDATGPYTKVPQYIYWRNNGEEIQFFGNSYPFYQPTQVPNPTTGWTRLDWRQHLTGNLIDGMQLHLGIARFFTPNKSELFPFDQATLDSYQGKLKQNPNY